MKILLDQNVPAPLTRLLAGHTAIHTSTIGWEALANGALLTAAEADGFELLITGDKNLRFQQNLAARTIAIVVISEIDWPTVRIGIDLIIAGLGDAEPGKVAFVELPGRQLRRRPRPDSAPR